MAADIKEAYVHGISTRSVDDLVKAMGAQGVSSNTQHRLIPTVEEQNGQRRLR